VLLYDQLIICKYIYVYTGHFIALKPYSLVSCKLNPVPSCYLPELKYLFMPCNLFNDAVSND
jgi:hypothetical protein